jgi:4a-hydroxytetrahydrobiopterin dehydratase
MVAAPLAERVARELPSWRIENEQLVGRWPYPDFGQPLSAAVRSGMLAERADHHPDLAVSWGRLEVRLTTHSAGELTAKDVELAGEIQRAIGPPGL